MSVTDTSLTSLSGSHPPQPTQQQNQKSPTESQTPGNDFMSKIEAAFAAPAEPAKDKPTVPVDQPAADGQNADGPDPAAPAADWVETIAPKGPQAEHWNKLKAERNAAQQELAKLKGQIGDPAEITNLRTQLEQANQELEKVAVEKSPKFKATYDTPIARKRERIGTLAGAHKDKVLGALSNPDQLDDVLAHLPVAKQAAITLAVAELQELESSRAEAIESQRQTYLQEMEQEHSQQQQDFTRALAQARTQVEQQILQWQAQGVHWFVPNGDPEHDAAVQQRVDLVRAVFTGELDTQDMLNASGWLAVGPTLAQELQQAQARIAELESRVQGSNPSFNTGRESSTPADGGYDPNLSLGDYIAQVAMREGAFRR